MSACGYARKADCGSEAVHCPGHPSVLVIPAGDNRRDSKNAGGVSGWEGASLKRRLATTKKRIVKGRSRRNVRGPFSASNCFYRQVNHGAIGVGLSGE